MGLNCCWWWWLLVQCSAVGPYLDQTLPRISWGWDRMEQDGGTMTGLVHRYFPFSVALPLPALPSLGPLLSSRISYAFPLPLPQPMIPSISDA